ncbi:spore germination protein [Bacillus benzoevorans]
MDSDKPLVKIRRRKKLFEEQKGNEFHDEAKNHKGSLDHLKERMLYVFGNTADLIFEDMKIAETDGLLFYLESSIDTQQLQNSLLNKHTFQETHAFDLHSEQGLKDYCRQQFGGAAYGIFNNDEEIINALLNGSVVIAISTFPIFISLSMANNNFRQVAEPTSQTVTRGPKDSFVEGLTTNMSLIRRRIRNANLCFEQFLIGSDTKTRVLIGYINGIANAEIVAEVRKRILDIDVSAVFESANIEELIADKTFTLFPLALNTERPDTACGNLIEGKIVIIVDGTPFVLIVPAVFPDFFVSAEDYYQDIYIASFTRLLRYISFLIVIITPAAYVAILTFHQEMLPTNLLISIIAQRQRVPFPAFIEVLIMEITFEILREAGIRLPRAVGQTVSIVGALVVGQAAALAGLISNIMVIIVAITATANFVAPVASLSAASRMLRFLLLLVASFLGLYGVLLGIVYMVAHLASLRSFGVPYLAPVAPFTKENLKDIFVRFPYWAMNKRPSYLRSPNQKKFPKQGSPSPPDLSGGSKG